MVKRVFFVLACALSAAAPAAVIDFEVDPDPPRANESFRLTYRAEGDLDREPDFTPLEAVLDILGRSRRTSIELINGRHTKNVIWTLDVMARKTGTVTIPPIAFGRDRSTSRTLEIAAAGAPAETAAPTDLLLEVEAGPRDPYVQQQVIYTVRLLRQVDLGNASLSEPESSGDAIIKQLGPAKQYQLRRGGRRYEVHEQKFAVFPQTSGTQTIEPVTLTAQVVRRARSRFDPFAQSVTTRRVRSEPIALEVRPIPDTFPGGVWLPAKRLRLHEDWSPASGEVPVGQPLTRTLHLWVDGLTAGQLPEIPMAPPEGVKTYPDQPQTSEEQTANGYNAIRQEKYAVIANTAGRIAVPPIEIPWWNTATDTLEFARLPERSIEAVDSGAAAEPPPARAAPAPDAPSTAAPAGAWGDSRFWFWAAWAALLAWAATLVAWFIQHRAASRGIAAAGERPQATTAARFKRDLRAACKANRAAEAKRALLQWAAHATGAPAPASLADLVPLVEPRLAAELQRLNEALYGRAGAAWDGASLWTAFRAHVDRRAPDHADRDDDLEPLFHLGRQ